MPRPEWASSRVARRWLLVGTVVLLFLAGRSATRSFGVEARLSDGAKAYASCKAPWRSARVAAPAQRFTLWAMIGGSGRLREEGVAALGARCRSRARARMGFAALGLVGSGTLAWLALTPRRRPTPPPPPTGGTMPP